LNITESPFDFIIAEPAVSSNGQESGMIPLYELCLMHFCGNFGITNSSVRALLRTYQNPCVLNHLGGGSVVKAWDQEIFSLWSQVQALWLLI